MVHCWSPEPPQECNDVDSTAQASNIVVYETDESDGEQIVSDGYELLPLDDAAVGSDDENLDGRESMSNVSHSLNFDPSDTSNTIPTVPSISPFEADSELDLPPRADIVVDTARIQAAMAQFSLPPSAIPSWASVIPESQWTHHLMSRINTLQNQRN
ncbi:uncharacterized protein [Bemisia tabaci]